MEPFEPTHRLSDFETRLPTFGDESPAAAIRRRRMFSFEQACRALPLVRRVVQDIVWTHEQARALHRQLERAAPGRSRQIVEDELHTVATRLQRFIDELTDLGVEIKNFHTGQVDFASTHPADDRPICLCWQLGERGIDQWHEIEASWSARRAVSELA